MAVRVQVTFDCADPARLAAFWAKALGYITPDPPPGHATWQDWLQAMGVPEDQWNARNAIEDPDGVGPRIFFQQVPEGKVVKNRLHLDVNVSGGRSVPLEERVKRVDSTAQRLCAEGATLVGPHPPEPDHYSVTMLDIEGNEFCLQ